MTKKRGPITDESPMTSARGRRVRPKFMRERNCTARFDGLQLISRGVVKNWKNLESRSRQGTFQSCTLHC
jgi:hypothetical protein